MSVIAIKRGRRARELAASVSDECGIGALVIYSDDRVGAWAATPIAEVLFCKTAIEWGGHHALSDEYPYALDNGKDVVLIDSLDLVERALERLGVSSNKLLVPLFELVDVMDEHLKKYQREALSQAKPV